MDYSYFRKEKIQTEIDKDYFVIKIHHSILWVVLEIFVYAMRKKASKTKGRFKNFFFLENALKIENKVFEFANKK